MRRKIDIAIQAGCSPIIERMCQRNLRLNPFETESLKPQRFEVGRTCGERVDRRTNVVHEVRQRQFCRTCAAAYCRVRFKNKNGTTGARQRDCGRKTIRPRSDDHRVILNAHETSKIAMAVFCESNSAPKPQAGHPACGAGGHLACCNRQARRLSASQPRWLCYAKITRSI